MEVKMYIGLGTVVLIIVLYLIFFRWRPPRTIVRLVDTQITLDAFAELVSEAG